MAYWSMNIKREEVERWGGRCRQASRIAKDKGNTELAWFLMGAYAALESTQYMEYGNDEEAFLSHVMYKFEAEDKYGRDED